MTTTNIDDEKNKQTIESLRETISSAEKTIQSAKAMLLQLEGKKKVGRKRKIEDDEGAIYGTFDGQIMIGNDGKQYPVPANYASKSKLVEGDMLKLVIDNGVFLYKQVGPVERKNLIGIAGQDEAGNYFVVADNNKYKILLASITYFKIEPGDEVVITIPAEGKSIWAAVENVLQKTDEENRSTASYETVKQEKPETNENTNESSLKELREESVQQKEAELTDLENDNETGTTLDDWMSDIEQIKKEIQEEKVKSE